MKKAVKKSYRSKRIGGRAVKRCGAAASDKLNYDPQGTLKVGDKVTTYYILAEKDVIRTLTHLNKSLLAEGGLASADGGDNGSPIDSIAAAWFLPHKE